MADWTNPVLTSHYSDFLAVLKDRDFDLATQFNATTSLATNLPVGTIRWNPVGQRWEERNASQGWDELTTLYKLNVEKLEGQPGSYYLDWSNFTGKPTTFPPSAHAHDDRYYTETEADARFGFSLDTLANFIRLKASDGSVLSTLTVPFATASGDAETVAGHQVNQNLRSTDGVTFNSVDVTTNLEVKGVLSVGTAGGNDSVVNFWDNNSDTWRSLFWDDSSNDWVVEDNAGTMRRLFHEGHTPSWSEISSKPSAFAPSPHGHVFDGTNRLQVRTALAAVNASLTGLEGELVYTTDDDRLYVHDATTVGGKRLAFSDDISDPQDLSNYARIDQATSFGSTVSVTGNLTSDSRVQGASIRAVDGSAASGTKHMVSLEGNGTPLRITNFSSGDYSIGPLNGGEIRLFDTAAAGVQVQAGGTTRFRVSNTSAEFSVPLTVQGNSIWHAGNDGDGSGLDADLLDGKQGNLFVTNTDGSILLNEPSGAKLRIGRDLTKSEVFFTPRLSDETGWDFDRDFGFNFANRNWYFEGALHIDGNEVWHAGNDGGGTGLNADLLDGFHASHFLPAASYTAADVLTKLKTVDGPNSGIDADRLDGHQASHFLPAAIYNADDVLAKLLTVDGAGSGLDADKLDGLNASAFVQTLRKIIAGDGLTGGGGLNADRTLAVDFDKVREVVKPPTVTILTSGANAIYVTPEGCRAIHVKGVGGGAGGQTPSNPGSGFRYGYPGGSGAGFEGWLTPFPLQQFNYTIGAGGSAGPTPGQSGGSGGLTRFGAMVAGGGSNIMAGSTATASNGDINYRGSPGRQNRDAPDNGRDHPMPPGGSIFGPSDSVADSLGGQDATVPGTGGAGGLYRASSVPPGPVSVGKNGADGIIVVTEFY